MKPSATLPIPAFLTISFAAATCILGQQPATDPRSDSAAHYGQLPLSFEANQGQTDSSVQFLSHGRGYTLFLRSGEAVLVLHGAETSASKADAPANARSQTNEIPPSPIRMQLVGSHLHAIAVPEDPQVTRTNYFLGNNPAKWQTDIHNYNRIRYRSVYDGIDIVYYGNQRQLEYDFVVAPGSSPARIRLRFTAASESRIDPHGDLLLEGANGEAILHKPLVYQEKDGHRQLIPGSFRRIHSNTVGFAIGSYDRTRPLIIDPVLVYSTYLGGSGADGHGDQGNGIAVDSAGSAYVVGTTYSTNFPLSAAPFQSQNNAALDNHRSTVFVSKFNPTGTALLYSTYLGGSGGDEGYAIALDSSGNAYITGATYSTDFPVTCGVLQTLSYSAPNGAPTAFVSKLNPVGSALVYSTYLGGAGNDFTPSQGDVSQSVAVDAAGNAYVAGYTFSSDFPVTSGAFQTHFAASPTTSNAFVTKLNPTATALVYSTFLGGSGSSGAGDYANSIAINASGDAFVAGSTGSANFPVSSGAFQRTLQGSSNAFVTELNPAGNDALYSTLLGGSVGDSAQAIALDSSGYAYIAGITHSSNFPTTSGVVEGATVGSGPYYAANIAGSAPAGFVAKLLPNGSELEFSTYLEGPGTYPTGLSVDSAGDDYIAGTASVPGAGLGAFGAFQTTPDALPTPTNSSTAAFLVKLNPTATVFDFASLIGGSSNDAANGLALESAGSSYLTGAAYSNDFPTTAGAFQTVNKAAANGASNAFASKFALAAEANQTEYPAPPSLPIPTSMTLVSEQGSWSDDCIQFNVSVIVTLNTGVTNPPPTGTVDFYVGLERPPNLDGVYGKWGGNTQVSLGGSTTTYEGISGNWQAIYLGDAEYLPSVTSGGVEVPPCNSSNLAPPKSESPGQSSDAAPLPQARQAAVHWNLTTNPAPAISTPVKPIVLGPKFIPAPSSPDPRERARTLPFSSARCSLPALTVTVNPETRLYGANNPDLTYTVTGLLNGDTIEVATQTYATNRSPVGAYNVTAVVRGAALDNYNLTVKDATLTVTQAPLTVTLSSVSRYYGSSNPTFAYKIIGLLNGDSSTITTSSPATAASPLGIYPITATLSGNALANYAPSIVDATLTVTKRPLNVVALAYYSTYGQTPPPPTKYAFVGFANGDTASVVSGAPVLTSSVTLAPNTPVGTYPVQVAVGTLSATNYTFVTSFSGQGVLRVLPASLRISVSPAATSRGYGAANPTYTNTVTGLVNGDTVTVTDQPSSPTTPIGTYPITVTLSGPASANYTASVVNGAKLTITSVPLTVTVLPASAQRTYGAANPTFTYSTVGLLNGDTLAPSTTAAATSPIGSYPVTVSGAALSNYTLTLHGATLVVTKAPLYISAKNVDSTYGQILPPPTAYTLTGFVNGDTASVVTGVPVLTTAVTSTTPAGNYKIGVQVGTLTAANYYFDNFSSGEGSVDVGKAPLTIRPNSFTIYAGDPLPTFTFIITGFVNGDTQASATTGAPTLTTTAPNNTTLGRYYIIAKTGTLTARNYSFNKPSETTNGILTILAN